jgi:hypothetical protein
MPPQASSSTTLSCSTSASVWAGGCVVLPEGGLYKPIWDYDAKTLAWDLSGHLAYGAGTGVAFWILARILQSASADDARLGLLEGYDRSHYPQWVMKLSAGLL